MLIALVNQFSLMQQQMFDQFQENVMMTSRMFSSLQKDQMVLVRQELDELRNLTAELRSLQGEINAHQAMPSARPAVEATAPNGAPAARSPVPNQPIQAGAPSPAQDHPAAEPPPAQTPQELHAWLSKRITALQEDRQTRWNKLLGMLLGS